MRVPDEIRKCVVFLGYEHPRMGKVLNGTAFLVGIGKDGCAFEYLVTAAHVIEGVRDKGVNRVFVRANEMSGTAVEIFTDLTQWYFHPTDSIMDVAVMPWT